MNEDQDPDTLDYFLSTLKLSEHSEKEEEHNKELERKQKHAIRQYAIPLFNELNPGIVRPEIQTPQFELKPVMFQMLQTMGQLSGMPTEDPHLHLHLFMEVSDSFKLLEVSEDALRLKLFPYSLRDQARAWLNSLPSDSVTTWEELA
ncbi:uncharacterized protein LOC133834253 [Humulus lupulus]|uniref:uncharacterized protein LOC133834253 n=1 Tax=Humulus lupulus TaxID=3486 RepID=UPI002B415CB5|nr:uncharacterized protein LOC133834253 [Humulus lupulus]